MIDRNIYKDDISVVLCGEAGQGIQTVESIASTVLKSAGYNIFASKEYMSRIRGGSNSTELRITSNPPKSYTSRIDILIPFDIQALEHLTNRITNTTTIIANQNIVGDLGYKYFDADLESIAKSVGGNIYINIVATGVVLGLFGIDFSFLKEQIEVRFAKKGKDIVSNNILAGEAGYTLAKKLLKIIEIDVKPDENVKKDMLISGADAIAMGAIAGGCDFIASYPMTPGTSVFTFLAQNSSEFGIVAEQVEDEISAINMAIGAWYAGARAMVSTSGGGFALMTEAISLSAMTETPVVVHLAQRPGPATGLPTRTEQADLDLVLYAGHGEFAKAIFAPGSLADAFEVSRMAFEVADKYQVPAFILSDQYFVDSSYNTKPFEIEDNPMKYVFESDATYMRYKNTDNGVSPRSIPSYGKGFVFVDSDEHDETGHITESDGMRVLMQNKRLKKLDALKQDVLPPELIGTSDYENLLICWGSTRNAVEEALIAIDNSKTAVLYFKQVYPLHQDTQTYLSKARKIVSIEGNSFGQFANLIKKELGFSMTNLILKYDGVPFSACALQNEINKLLEL